MTWCSQRIYYTQTIVLENPSWYFSSWIVVSKVGDASVICHRTLRLDDLTITLQFQVPRPHYYLSLGFLSCDAHPSMRLGISPVVAGKDVPKGTPRRQGR